MKTAVPARNEVVDAQFSHCENLAVFCFNDQDRIVSGGGANPPAGCSGPAGQVVEACAAGDLTDDPVICRNHGSCPGG